MANLNQCRLQGYIGKDPKLQYAPLAEWPKPVLKLRLAVTYRFGEKEKTDWHTIVFWGDQALYAEKNYRKGDNIEVDGSYHSRTFTPKDGSERTVFELTVFRSYKIHRNPKSREEQPPALNEPPEDHDLSPEEAANAPGPDRDAWPS